MSDATDSPIAVQNAFPKTSSAHARQFDGSPEHVAGAEVVGFAVVEAAVDGDTGKSVLRPGFTGRRRKGTGG